MKKKIFLLSSLIIFIFIILIYFINQENVLEITSSDNNFKMVEGVSKNLGNLNITVDPRIELLTAIQQQADYGLLTELDFEYKDEMKEKFNQYNNHKAIEIFKKLGALGFSYDAPPSVMLYLSNNLTIRENYTIPDNIMLRASDQNNLSEFINEVKNFSIETDFNSFYSQNIPFYTNMVDNVYNSIKDMGLIEALDNYYGMEVNSYNLILSPLLHPGGYGPRIKADNSLYDVYGIIGPHNINKDNEGKVLPEYSSKSIQYIAWHEFGHSFINPTTEKYINEINQCENLFTKIETQMQQLAYTSWENCVNEHIIRAITARLIYLHHGQSAYDIVIANERANSFYYVPALCESLENYENSRNIYPTLESYYPELISVFKELSEQDLDDDFYSINFSGPINAPSNNMNVAIIVSTEEKDPDIQKQISSYVIKIKNKFHPNAEIINDTEAIERDLGDYKIIAYGTMEGNAWLRKYKDTFPFKVEPNILVADKEYEDSGLVLISALPNPQNHKNPLIIYTAQGAYDIININSIFHGPTDYIIAKYRKELSSGFYIKNKEIWSFE